MDMSPNLLELFEQQQFLEPGKHGQERLAELGVQHKLVRIHQGATQSQISQGHLWANQLGTGLQVVIDYLQHVA